MKRKLVALCLLLCFLGACAPETSVPSVADTAPPAPLRIGWWGSQIRHDATLAVIDLYTQKTGVPISAEFFNLDNYVAKLSTLIASHDAYDIMQMGGNFPTYTAQIESLNNYIDRGLIDVSQIPQEYINLTTFEGDVVGLSLGVNGRAIAYDPALFHAAGAKTPTFDWTWDEYEKAALRIHDELGILGSSQLEEFILLAHWWVKQYGTGENVLKNPFKLSLDYSDDSMVAAFFEMKKTLTDAGAYPTPAEIAEIRGDIERDPLVRGQAAMTWVASNQFIALSAAAGRPLRLVCPPRRYKDGPLGLTIVSSQMFSLYNEGTQKDEAAKFISFFVNDIEANKILNGERGVPISAAVRDALAPGLTDAQKEVYAYLEAAAREAATEIELDSPLSNQLKEAYTKLSEEVVFGQITPQEAAVQFRRSCESILKSAAATQPQE